jgi:hypothetical protein
MRAFQFGVIALPLVGVWAGCGDDEEIFAPVSGTGGKLGMYADPNQGQAGDQPVDPCDRDNGGCSAHAYCSTDGGAVECECKPGYFGDGFDCVEFDACSLDNGGCSDHATCRSSSGAVTCVCHVGFEGNGIECEDIDECAKDNGGCDPEATCKNLPGSSDCGCPEGLQGDGESCSDADECTRDNGGCSADATCTNTPGSRECECNPGFEGDGETCTEIDECGDDNPCADDAVCSQTPEGPSCACKVGYEGDGKTCQDIDECDDDNGGCALEAVCTNRPGSRDCECPEGFEGDGAECQDIDECAKYNGGCSENALCENRAGSLECTCKEGFEGDGHDCGDIDECRTNHGGCDENAECINLAGGHRCSCYDGFVGDGLSCVPADDGYTVRELSRADCDDLSAEPDLTSDECYASYGCKSAGGGATNARDFGFPFQFFGRPIAKFYLARSGYVRMIETGFTATEHESPPYQGLDSPSVSNGIVAPFWSFLTDRLTESGGHTNTLKFGVFGTAPRRHLTAEWRDFAPAEPSGAPGPGSLTFQVKLFEGSNRIEAHYCDMHADAPLDDWVRGLPNSDQGEVVIGLKSGDSVRSVRHAGSIGAGLRFDIVRGSADCAEGYADCDGDPETGAAGCETNLLTDPRHCGSCQAAPCPRGTASTATNSNGNPVCDFGRCSVECVANYADCNGAGGDGCEIAIYSEYANALHCGGCGRECGDGWGGRCLGLTCR